MADYTEATYVDGVMRWKSNDRVPPKECIMEAFEKGFPVDVDKSLEISDKETSEFLENYRKNYRGPYEEDRMEARAAFGPGVELVNVITGKKWKT